MNLPPLPRVPRVSVVIPCLNEAGHIGRCLASLEAADRTGMQLSVLVCDGGSTDGTRDEIADHRERSPVVHLVENPDRTTPHAMNRGLAARPFDVAILLGAHATVEPDWLVRNLAALRSDAGAGCAGGVIINTYTDATSRAIGAAMGHPFGVGNAHFRTGTKAGPVDTVAFGAYRREVFERVGTFHEALVRNQDDEFNHRVTQAGFRILLDPAIRSSYAVRASFAKLYRQYHQYGYWKVYVNRLHRTVTTWRQVVPAAWVAGLMLGPALGLVWPWAAWATGAGVLGYLAAAGWSAWRAAEQPADVPRVLYAFLILHLAYGLGYWKGIVHFVLLGRRPGQRAGRLTR